MFEQRGSGSGSIVDRIAGSWRAKNRADARMLIAIGELFQVQLRDSGECASWAADTTDAVAAEVSAALNISAGWAADYVLNARCLREDLPCVGAVFAAGDIRSGSMKRVAAASGEGASVVPLVHAYLAPAPDDDVSAVAPTP